MKNQKGYTLIEVSVATVVIAAILTAFVTLNIILNQSRITSIASSNDVEESNRAISQLTRELRTAQYGENGAYPIEAALDNDLIFYSDVDFDGRVEKVRYYINGTSLTKSVIEPTGNPITYPSNSAKTRVITDFLSNDTQPLFTYYNSSWPGDTQNNPLPTPADLLNIGLIKIYVSVNTKDNVNDGYTLETMTHLRMLKTNL